MNDASPPGSVLRFGIMSDDGLRFPAWQAECLLGLTALPNVVPALVIHNATPVSSSAAARLGRARPNLLLGQLYRNLVSRPRALRPADLSGVLGRVPSMRCVVEKRGRFSEYFSGQDVAAIRGHRLDFILRFGFNIIKGDVLHAARFGVWSFHHGDEEKYRGVSEGFWEITRGEHVAGAILQRLGEALDAGTVLKKGHFAVVGHSWTKTRDALYFGSARWPTQVCTDLLNGVGGYVDGQPSRTTAPLYRRPTNLETVGHCTRVLRNLIRHGFGRAFVQATWGLGVIDEPAERLLRGPRPAVRYVAGSSGRYRYLADPFVVALRPPGTVCLLCEEYDLWTHNKGTIVYAELEGGRVTAVTPALPMKVHGSYPFVIRHGGEVFCLPEAAGAGRIELYRAVEVPGNWVLERVLVEDFPAVDPTVFQHGGRWWLAASSARDGPYHNLFLWHADSLLGPWQPHAGNPVKCDVRSARPAGTPFVADGILYRPAQDCSDGYGRRVAVNAVEKLTPLEYRETVAAVLEPDPTGPFPHGTHTLASAGGVTLVDGRRDFVDPFKLIKKVLLGRIVRRFGRGATGNGAGG